MQRNVKYFSFFHKAAESFIFCNKCETCCSREMIPEPEREAKIFGAKVQQRHTERDTK